MAEEENETAPEEVKQEAAESSDDVAAVSGEANAEATAPAEKVAEKAVDAAAPAEKAADAAEASSDAPAGQASGEGEQKPAGEAGAATTDGKPKGEKGAGQDIFLALDPSEGEKPKILKAKGSKNVSGGIVHVLATFNNTIVTVSDRSGNVIGWSSAGKMGFKGSRKSTAYAAQLVSQDACRQAMGHGFREADVRVKGPGSGRESAVRAVQAIGIEILSIRDVTPVPHNGCRPPKARRV